MIYTKELTYIQKEQKKITTDIHNHNKLTNLYTCINIHPTQTQ